METKAEKAAKLRPIPLPHTGAASVEVVSLADEAPAFALARRWQSNEGEEEIHWPFRTACADYLGQPMLKQRALWAVPDCW